MMGDEHVSSVMIPENFSLLNNKPEMKVKAKKAFELNSNNSSSTIFIMQIRHGLGVRIAGSHPAGPGSIPGVGTYFYHFVHFYRLFGICSTTVYRNFKTV